MNNNVLAFASDEYDKKIRQTLPFYEEFYNQITGLIKTVYDKPVSWLDIGCGTGKMGQAALESGITLSRGVFCDISQEMLDIAKGRFVGTEFEFHISDARKMSYKEQFDVVTAVQVLHYLHEDDRKTAMERCYDALKENGSFISFENISPFSEIGRNVYLDKWKRYQEANGKSPEESSRHIARYGKDYFPINIEEHLKLMRSCGFQAVEVLWFSNMQAGFWGMK